MRNNQTKTNPMTFIKALLLGVVLCGLSLLDVNAQVTVNPGSGSYATLQLAFAAINAGTHTGAVTVSITDNTTETVSAVLNASGTGSASYTSVSIYPTVSGMTISGNLATPLIDLNGADNVTIDGRLNASGSSIDLTITNTNATNVTSTIRFTNDATTNTIKYCTLKGASTQTMPIAYISGIINIGTSGTGNGNDDIIISNNNITNSGTRPMCAIFASGTNTSGKENSGVIILENNIYDIFSGLQISGSYINVQSGNTDFQITSNSFYETTTWVRNGATTYCGINIDNTSGNNFNVSNNYIGGSLPFCGGAALARSGTYLEDHFICIYMNVGTTTASNIQGNTITNWNYSNLAFKNWYGIYVAGGSVNIGTTTANTIGAGSGTGSITVTKTHFYGIYLTGSGVLDIQNNIIGSITNNKNLLSIYGINASSTSGTLTIKNNTIGSTTTANSIYATHNTNTGIWGINVTSTGTTAISGNTIANISSNATTATSLTGIRYSGSSNTASICGNFLREISYTSAANIATLTGIDLVAGTNSTYNNIISLGNNNPGLIYGIATAAGTNNIYFNTVYISGTPTSGAYTSAALYSSAANTRDIRNNIFFNARANAGATGKHFAAYLAYTVNTNLTMDNNDYYISGTGGMLGYHTTGSYSAANDISTIAAWKTATGQDANSLAINPSFAIAGGTFAANYRPSASLSGITGTGITTDYAGTSRAPTPSMGAYEYVVSTLPTITSFSPASAPTGATVTITGTAFTGTTAVSFGGTAATSFTVNSATGISAVVGEGTSGSVSVTTPGGTASLAGFGYFTKPDAPTSLVATLGNGSASIAFTAGSNGGSNFTNYEYSTDNGTTWTACEPAVTTSPVSITGLTNGSTYQVKLRAINMLGTGTASSAVSVTPRTTPGMPTQLTATEASGSATISFTAGSNGGSAITNYVYSTDDGSTWTTCSPATTSSPITITGLANGLTYKVKIKGVNGAGSGAPSAFISVKPNNSFTWIGGDSADKNDWNNPNNWDKGSVPTSTDNVVIPQVTDKPQTSSSLSVASNGKLTINANSQVEVTGSVQNSGTILIKSDAGGTGSLITSDLASGAGQALVERYMAQNEWHIISSPTGTQTIQDFLADNIDIPIVSGTATIQYGMMDFDPASGLWNSYFTDATTGTLGVGRGYMVRIQDPVQTLRFQGTINTTADASVSKGWNCIGNPFTSAIKINSNAGENNFMTINATLFETNYAGLYFWDQQSGLYVVVNNTSASYKAAIGQGFFMKVKQGISSVTFSPAMQVHQVDAPFKASNVVNPSIKLKVQSGSRSFTTDILFIDGTTKGLDFGYDAGLLAIDKSFALYTRLAEDNGTDFQLQCLPTNGYDKMVIPLGLDSKAGGEIVFSVETVQLEAGCKAILEDKLTNTFTDLSTGSYKATVAANTAGTGRFFLHTADIISGVEDQVLSEKLTAYAVRNVEIRVIGEVGESAVATLYNGLGKVLLTKKLGGGSLNIIGLPNLSSGIYLLNINDKGTAQTIKMMIRK